MLAFIGYWLAAFASVCDGTVFFMQTVCLAWFKMAESMKRTFANYFRSFPKESWRSILTHRSTHSGMNWTRLSVLGLENSWMHLVFN